MSFCKALLAAVCLSFTFPNLSAQTSFIVNEILTNKNTKPGGTNDLYFLGKKSVQQHFAATDFLNPSFVEAEFVDASNKLFKVQARYNVRYDHVQILFHEQIYILHPYLVQVVQIGNRSFSPQLVEINDIRHYTYLQAEVVGKWSLLKKISKNEQEKKPTLFVKNRRGRATKLKTKQKAVLAILADHKTKIERFVIENNLSYCRFEDLKQIFEYYNQL